MCFDPLTLAEVGVCSKHSLAKAGGFGQNVPFDERNRTRLVFSC